MIVLFCTCLLFALMLLFKLTLLILLLFVLLIYNGGSSKRCFVWFTLKFGFETPKSLPRAWKDLSTNVSTVRPIWIAILSYCTWYDLTNLTNVPNLLLLSIIIKFPPSYLINACNLDTEISEILISH